MVEEEIIDEDMADEQMEDTMEKQHDIQSDLYDDSTPSSTQKDDLWSLFKWTIARKDSSKIAFLDGRELGMLNISVRDMQRIALIADTLDRIGFAKFFRSQAEIILATSNSRGGFLLNKFIEQRKYSVKSKEGGGPTAQQPLQPPKKKGFFKKWVG